MIKRKKDNKGFTLVELVVVIAILAILVGLLVPQYTKYVDKARKSSDASNLGNMVRAVEIKAADPNGTLAAGVIKIEISDTKTTVGAFQADGTTPVADQKTVVETAIQETMGENVLTTKLKSTSWTDNKISATITIGTDYSFKTEYSTGVSEYISGAKEQ